MESPKSELRDGMRIDWDIPIVMDDGLLLRADLFRPGVEGAARCCSAMALRQGLASRTLPERWQRMISEHPEVAAARRASTRLEVVDPEKWVPAGLPCCGSTRAAPAARPAAWHFAPRETTGPVPVHRVGGRAACRAQGRLTHPYSPSTSGTPLGCSRCTWPPCVSGTGRADWYRTDDHGGILCRSGRTGTTCR